MSSSREKGGKNNEGYSQTLQLLVIPEGQPVDYISLSSINFPDIISLDVQTK